MDSDYENLSVERQQSIATITIRSTSKHNALNSRMTEELRSSIVDLDDAGGLRSIVLRGSDGAFCAGADLAQFEGDETDSKPVRRLATGLHSTIDLIHQAETPVLTGINGVAAGGGFGLAICGDLAIMSDAAILHFVYPQIGQSADGGSSFFLPRYVGLRRAKDIAFRDEPIPADEASDIGLVTEAVPHAEFESRLFEVAESVAAGPTHAYGETKRLLLNSFHNGLRDQLAAETRSVSRLTQTDDWEEGISAFVRDREPEFSGQ